MDDEVILCEAVMRYYGSGKRGGKYTRLRTEVQEDVVRCRDCVHFDSASPLPICELLEFGAADQAEKGFCAWGERVG